MKRWLLLFAVLILCIGFVGCAVMKKAPESDLTFQRIVDLPDFNKDEIYSKARIWVAKNFMSAKRVIEKDDIAKGIMVSNGILKYPCKGFEAFDCIAKSDWKVPFTMRVDVKDGKLRLTFYDLYLSGPSEVDRTFDYQNGKRVAMIRKRDLDSIKPELLKIGDKIRQFMVLAEKEDW